MAGHSFSSAISSDGWQNWLRVSKTQDIKDLPASRYLDTPAGPIEFRAPSEQVLTRVLDSIQLDDLPDSSQPTHTTVLIAAWEWLRARPRALNWPTSLTRFTGEDFQARVEYGGQAISFDNESQHSAVWAVRNPDDPRWSRPEFVRPLLGPLIEKTGLIPAHGATLGLHGEAVLLTNRGGSGKSTLALTGVLNGLDTSGDDFLALQDTDSLLRSWPLFRAGKISPASPAWPLVEHRISSPLIDDKHVVQFSTLSNRDPVRGHRIRALVIPEISSSTTLTPTSLETALGALLPSSARLSDKTSRVITSLSQAVRDLPCFRLEVSPNPAEAIELLRELIAS